MRKEKLEKENKNLIFWIATAVLMLLFGSYYIFSTFPTGEEWYMEPN